MSDNGYIASSAVLFATQQELSRKKEEIINPQKGATMRRFIVSAVLVLSLAGVLPADAQPSQPPKWTTSPAKVMVDQARATTKQVTIDELKTALDKQEDVVVLDVREPNEYEAAHIPDAINIPRGLLEFSIWSVVPNKEKKIFVYCKTGVRAALATKLLNEFGYKNALAVATGGADTNLDY
jgi:rhodanese-related sulfurtransferase